LINYIEGTNRIEENEVEKRYFILDTASNPLLYSEKNFEERDFINYIWHTNRFNKVREGDKFIYRRPGKASEIKGEFYLFGAGEITKISKGLFLNDPKRVNADLGNCVKFENYIKKSDLENFKWSFKERKKGSWGHFFNQYGMNEITKEDYNNILNLGNIIQINNSEEVTACEDAQRKVSNKDYYVDDLYSLTKRRQYHSVFAGEVKRNYKYRCPVTDIDDLSFLRASHIIPWSEKKECRLDPKNGICLYCDIDLAFDRGYISFHPETLQVTLSDKVKNNKSIYEKLKPYEGVKLQLKKEYAPKREYLEWHYNKYVK